MQWTKSVQTNSQKINWWSWSRTPIGSQNQKKLQVVLACFTLRWRESLGLSFSPFLHSASLCFGFTLRMAFSTGKPWWLQAYYHYSSNQNRKGGLFSLVPPELVDELGPHGHPRMGHEVEWCWGSANAVHPQLPFLHWRCRSNCSLYSQASGRGTES